MKTSYITPALRLVPLVGGTQILEQSFTVVIGIEEWAEEFDVKVERGYGTKVWDEVW